MKSITNEKKIRNEANTVKAAEIRRSSLETFSESNTRFGNKSILKVKQYNFYVKKVIINWN